MCIRDRLETGRREPYGGVREAVGKCEPIRIIGMSGALDESAASSRSREEIRHHLQRLGSEVAHHETRQPRRKSVGRIDHESAKRKPRNGRQIATCDRNIRRPAERSDDVVQRPANELAKIANESLDAVPVSYTHL